VSGRPLSSLLFTSFVVLVGCGREDVTLELAMSDVVPTVANVMWDTRYNAVDAVWLEYGLTEDLTMRRTLPGNGAKVPLLGLKAGHAYWARVVVDVGGKTSASATVSFETGNPPPDFPEVDVEVFDVDRAHTGFLVTTLFVSPTAPVILDSDGDYVWWYVPDNAYDVNYSRAAISAEAGVVWAWTLNVQGSSGGDDDSCGSKVDDEFTLGVFVGPCGDGQPHLALNGDQALLKIPWDGGDVESYQIPDGHHDMVALPSGSIAYLKYDRRILDGEKYEGDRIIERARDGGTSEMWSVWDDFTPTDIPQVPGMTWSHANALDYVSDQGAYYLSALGMGALLKIDREGGFVDWVLGGADSDFTESTDLEYAPAMWGHQFDVFDDRVLLFENGESERMFSQVLEFQLDEASGKADVVWSYRPKPDIYSFSLGDVQRLESGNTLVTFSNQGLIEEVSPEGEVLWRLSMSVGGALGYLTHLDTLP